MLSALGIIAEFNPFHNGHRRLIRVARRRSGADVVVAVMSGNWVQRGQPAIIDKWARTRMALNNGVNLVIELPAVFAAQSASRFALAAVRLVKAVGCHWLAFGCEDPQWNFNQLARVRLTDSNWFRHSHASYADVAREYFYRRTGVRLTGPNDLLALNYSRAKRKLSARFRLLPVQRQGKHHSSLLPKNSRFTSSSALRRQLLRSGQVTSIRQWIPEGELSVFHPPWMSWQLLWPLLRYQLVESPLPSLRAIYQMNEGLEYRLHRAAIQCSTFRSFLNAVKTRRYTYSRLQRLCFYVMVKLTRSTWRRIRSQAFVRILGFDRLGRAYLHQIKKSCPLPLITTANRDVLRHDLRWEFKAGMLIEMLNHRSEDLGRHPIIR